MLLHWEDFGAKDAFRLLSLYQKKAVLPTFNDDIQSTAAAVLAAMLGAVRVPGVPPLAQQRVLFFGAGQANIGAAKLFVAARKAEGATEFEAKNQVWLMDSQGLVTKDRTDLSKEKAEFAREPVPGAEGGKLSRAVFELRPTALIGAASVQVGLGIHPFPSPRWVPLPAHLLIVLEDMIVEEIPLFCCSSIGKVLFEGLQYRLFVSELIEPFALAWRRSFAGCLLTGGHRADHDRHAAPRGPDRAPDHHGAEQPPHAL